MSHHYWLNRRKYDHKVVPEEVCFGQHCVTIYSFFPEGKLWFEDNFIATAFEWHVPRTMNHTNLSHHASYTQAAFQNALTQTREYGTSWPFVKWRTILCTARVERCTSQWRTYNFQTSSLLRTTQNLTQNMHSLSRLDVRVKGWMTRVPFLEVTEYLSA